ncbi:mycofactocin biosynthesis glycosyltransferase MftF [Saccharopolyspora sp. 7B]|uniref:mycofactocin biosynthesis glycosyltransferase MftF n=1 Tax=Saccharopolyspora sp. 7B TaxID=2877240 RepID=UPI001CD7498D|nr:mycofactocin biosynthesis glycosyltransferase MftF [Saccharopolyspora sp. 7B]MCA1279367.1 mycofactocin biosynthesis glycosyltransferase MftF [Saccharopolyspora sp. 7B]
MSAPVPPGTRLVPDPSLRRARDGQVLLGGSPVRLLRVGARAARLVDRWFAGEPVREGGALARRLLDSGLAHPEPPAGELGPADVTLVVPVKDDPAGLARVLAATAELPHRIVVDDGSQEPAAELRHPVARGPAAARNTGWRRARTELVAFLDADVLPEPGWLAPLLRQFTDPAVHAVAPRARGAAGGGAIACYEADRGGLDLGALPAGVRPMSRVGYVPSAALVVRRAALAELGGFDEALRFGEDVDLVWRIVDSGAVVRYVPGSVVRHRPRSGLRSWLRQRFDYGTSAAPLARRHPGRLCCARLSPWSAASWAALVAGRPVLAAGLATGSAAVLPRKLRAHGVPDREAWRLAVRGHLGAGRLLAEAARRAWFPLLLVSRRSRAVLLVAALPCAWEALRHRRGPGWFALRLLDDLAYGCGVWAGCARERCAAPLLPRFTGRTTR